MLCMVVSPQMQKIHDSYAERGVGVLAVHYGDQGEPMRYTEQNSFTFAVLDEGLATARLMGVSKIPTVMIIGPEERVVHRQTGFAAGDEQKLVVVIEQYTKQVASEE